jgi:hypothetical protein
VTQGMGEDVQEALFELQQYLSDRLAPLMVADSVSLLTGHPPALAAGEIQRWTLAQYRGTATAVPVSDYLFHAVKKLHALGELQLLPASILDDYLSKLGEEILRVCPEDDRELLATNLAALGKPQGGPADAVGIVYRQPGSGDLGTAPLASSATALAAGRSPAGEALSPEATRGLRRFTLLLEQLARAPALAPGAPSAPVGHERRREVVSEAVAAAVASAASGQELDGHLAQLQRMGVAGRTEQIFQDLASSLPGWALSGTVAEAGVVPPASESVPAQAMHRLVTLAPDANETASRYRHLVHAAIKELNEGLLTRAATMVDLCERIAADKEVPAPVVEAARGTNLEFFNEERLRKVAESADKHALLRRVMGFFVKLRPEGLLLELQREERHDRRRLFLALLEVHEAPARAAALKALQESVARGEGTATPYFLRNLVYLLRLIPRPDDAPLETEVDLVVRAGRSGGFANLVKEAIAYLGKVRHERSEAALISYLRVFEAMMLNPATAPYDEATIATLLDRTSSALARLGTRNAVRVVVDHGLRDSTQLGRNRTRLTDLGTQDLSAHPDALNRLLVALRAEMSKGTVGRLLAKSKDDAATPVVHALSGTPAPEVRAAFGEMTAKYPAEPFGRAAAKALAAFGGPPSPPAPAASLSGDLQMFELPNLLQNIGEIRATGTLTLFDAAEAVVSVIGFREGRMVRMETGLLRGPEAIYQTLERPFPGRFAFVGSKVEAGEGAASEKPANTMSLLLEGLRRHDELRRCVALVPDEGVLRATGVAFSRPEDEPNVALVEAVWERARDGSTAVDCEQGIPVDSYRVRRLLAHWVEEGSLALA